MSNGTMSQLVSRRNDAPPPEFPWKCPKGYDIRWVRTSAVRRNADPFNGCWPDLLKPLTVQDVVAELEAGQAVLHDEFVPWWAISSEVDLNSPEEQARRRQLHAQKVAWFALHGFQTPLEVDVGVPSLGLWIAYPVQDGNHRLAAGIARQELLGEDPWLPLSVGGSVDHAKERGLW